MFREGRWKQQKSVFIQYFKVFYEQTNIIYLIMHQTVMFNAVQTRPKVQNTKTKTELNACHQDKKLNSKQQKLKGQAKIQEHGRNE